MATGPCNSNGCRLCNFMEECDGFVSSKTERYFEIRGNNYFDCSWRNVIYLVTCETCEDQYVGQTG